MAYDDQKLPDCEICTPENNKGCKGCPIANPMQSIIHEAIEELDRQCKEDDKVV